MADRRLIESRIKKKELEIQELELKMQSAKTYLQALQDVLKMFPKSTTPLPNAESTLRAGSLVARARDIIIKFGKPLHVDEMLEAMDKELSRENKIALGGSLSAYVRKGTIFTRPGRNVFGLVELPAQDSTNSEPPPNFGIESTGSDGDEDDIPF